MDKITTTKYNITAEQIAATGPGGYESVYLAREGDSPSARLLQRFGQYTGTLLPIQNKTIRTRNGDVLLEALLNNHHMGLASGFKPSGAAHFGHKLTASAVGYFQKNGVQVFMPVADIECSMDENMNPEQYRRWSADNLVDWGANGVNLDAAHVYLQSEESRVLQLAYIVAQSVSFDLVVDTYGFTKMAAAFPFLFAGLTQVGDIILPQHNDFGNRHSFMVSGPDQDGHMAMTTALVKRSMAKVKGIPGLKTLPSAFYIPHIRGLEGKMSSSRPESTLYLGPGPNNLALEQRTHVGERLIDEALLDEENTVLECALDLVRYTDFFNARSAVHFGEATSSKKYEALTLALEKASGKIEKDMAQRAIDKYLIDLCNAAKQDNVALVRDSLKQALEDHYKKRKQVIEYARAKATGVLAKRPTNWDVPHKAVVDPKKRTPTAWYDIVNAGNVQP